MRVFVWINLFWIAWVVAGCSTVPEKGDVSAQPQPDWSTRQESLGALQQWRLEGRIALKIGDDGGQSGLIWSHAPESMRFELSGLFGIGATVLSSDAAEVTLRSGDKSYHGSDPVALLAEVTGWQIPLQSAHYWVRGLPDPVLEVESMLLDGMNRLSRLEQAGWTVEVRRYQRHEALELPAYIVLQRNEVKIKFRLQRWELNP